ncbi:MAG: glutathione S-transferase family protein [Pseudomonadota bacterium]
MKLYSSPASPFARKVRALIIETNQSEEVEIIDTSGNALDPGTHPTALNPTSKIPVLERTDGPALYDSRVICRFLDNRKGAGLYPDPPRLWDTLVLEATADAVMEAALAIVYEARLRPEEMRFAPWVDGQWAKIVGALDHIEARWMSHLHGRRDMGHIAIACALGYLDLRLDDRNWRAGHDALSAWEAKEADRPALAQTRPPPP